jgi:DNA ligase (NAD+)
MGAPMYNSYILIYTSLGVFMQALMSTPINELSDNQLSYLADYFDDQYEKGTPVISDEEYDFAYIPALKERLPNHAVLTKVRAKPLGIGAKGRFKHPVKMLSTDKAYTKEEVQKWFDRVIKHGAKLGLSPAEIIIDASSKLDGIALRYNKETKQCFTRGDGEFGSDVSHMSQNGLVIIGGHNNDKNIIGEAVMKNTHFEKHFSVAVLGEDDGYVDSRGFIAGVANSNDIKPNSRKALNNGFIELIVYSDMPRTSVTADKFMESYELLEEKHLQLQEVYLLDGVIFDVMNDDIRESLGETSHHPVWRLALKKKKGAIQVSPHNIRWQVGRTCVMTPVLQIAPTQIGRVTVTSITGHSLGYVKKHGLGVGSTFMAHRAGDVIPSFLESVDRVAVNHPVTCPCCESPTEIRMGLDKDKEPCEFLYCSNSECGGSAATSLYHAFKRLGIDLFGDKACEKLIIHGVTTLPEVFELTAQDYIRIGFGAGQAANFTEEIARGKRETLKDTHLVASLGIHTLGRGNAEKILVNYKISELSALSYDQIFNIDGFADISTKAVLSGLVEKKEVLAYLLAQNFNLTHTSEVEEITHSDNGLAGLSVCFTGTMVQGNRDQMKADAKSKGAIVQSSLNGKSNLLIAGLKAGSKITKAEELGVEVINEAQYIERYAS